MSKKPLRSQARNIVYHVYNKICDEGGVSETRSAIFNRVFQLTGVSRSTVRRIVEEGTTHDGVFSTPGKNRKGGCKRINLDNFDLEVIRNKIKEFYTVRKEIPTVAKLLKVLQEDIDFKGGRESLRVILTKIGFEYVKCQSKRTLLMERHDIKIQRHKYLERMKQNRDAEENKKLDVIYLDETYIHSSCSVQKCWQSQTIRGPSKEISPGSRWIIVHAGGQHGFVPNCGLVYKTKSLSADYHHDMNKDNFTKWITEKLIPNLTKPSLIVMDNASYHSVGLNKPPTQANRVSDIKEWLSTNNINYDDRWRKCELLEAVKQNRSDPIYEIDEILKSRGHEVLRLPPNHCTLNPIELIWGIMKQKVADKNVNRPASDIKALTEQAFLEIGENEWHRCCQHVEKIESDFMHQDKIIDVMEERFIVNLSPSSSSSSEEEPEIQEEYLELYSSDT